MHGRGSLLSKCAIEEPGDDGEIAPLVVSWQDHRVFVFWNWRHTVRREIMVDVYRHDLKEAKWLQKDDLDRLASLDDEHEPRDLAPCKSTRHRRAFYLRLERREGPALPPAHMPGITIL